MERKTLVEEYAPSILPSKRKEEEPTRRPLADRKIKIYVARRTNQVMKWISRNLHSKSRLFHLYVINAKKHEAMVTELKKKMRH